MRLLGVSACAAFVALAAGASAAITAVRGVSSPASVESGVIVNELFIDFDGQLGGQQLYIELNNGTVYNTPGFGGDVSPSAAFIGLVPALADDSFVAMGGDTSEASEGVLTVGGAVNLPGAPADLNIGAPDSSFLSVAWAPAAGTVIEDKTDFLIAQISLSDDAMGTVWYFGSTIGEEPLLLAGTVWDGQLFEIIPEPSSIALVLMGLGYRSRTAR